MLNLVTAAITSSIPKNAPDEILYIPVGSNKITPSVNGKPKTVTVNVSEERGDSIAAALQKALEVRLSSPVRPRLAFDHSATGPASGHPKSFRFGDVETQDGVKRGIILKLNWSNSGRAAVEGGDYGYISPSFMLGENGEPVGLPDKGEIGSLVDEPAFRTIGLIAASDQQEPLNTQTDIMDKQILAALNISESAADAGGAAVVAVNAMKSEITTLKASETKLKGDNKELADKLEAAEKKIADGRKRDGEALFERAVTAGVAAPKDDEDKKTYVDAHEQENALGIKLLNDKVEAAEAAIKDGKVTPLNQPIIKSGQNKKTEVVAEKSGHELLVSALDADIEKA